MLTQLLKFVGVGVIATGIQYVILICLMETGVMGAVPASNLGFVISAGVNYWLNYHFTFSSDEKHIKSATKFSIVAALGLLINHSIMWLLITTIGLYYVAAQLLATAGVLFWNFFINRAWTFRSRI